MNRAERGWRVGSVSTAPATRGVGDLHKLAHSPPSMHQAGMLRTIEEILRLPPLTEFDATATPMDALFTATATADTHPFSAVAPLPPKTSPATLRAARELSLRRFGPHPGLQSVKPSDQRDIAWLEARGTLVRAPTWSSTERLQAAQILHGHTASRP